MAIPQILQQLGSGQSLTIPPQIKQLASAVRSAGNPQAMLNQLMQTNPQMKQVAELVNQAGGNPKQAFYTLAKQKGVDPEAILSQLR